MEFWDKPVLPVSVFRTELSHINTWPSDLVLVVQGVRRCGKSTLLMQHLKLDPQSCFFINFEDPRLANLLSFEILDAVVSFAEKKV